MRGDCGRSSEGRFISLLSCFPRLAGRLGLDVFAFVVASRGDGDDEKLR